MIKQLTSAPTNVQMICFPFAGGNASAFRPFAQLLKNECNVLAVEPPGHGTNCMPLIEHFEQLVDTYYKMLLSVVTKPFILFGHSMGGLVVYRVAQKLESQGILPEMTIISAIHPPDIPHEKVSHYPDDELLDYVMSLGGIPVELVEEKELLHFFLPMFRADFKAIESFCHVDQTLLRSPVHIFNGKEDYKYYNQAEGWKKWAQQVEFHEFNGDHMFLLTETESVAECIRMLLPKKLRV